MPFLPPDERFLQRALDLAREAAAFASPNPSVGCVLVAGEQIVGEGAHHFDARDHAEIVALKQANAAGHSVRDATAFVTLEPCSHHGRTGPCADALIAAGIARCVIASSDPNPLVRGQGLAKLRAAAIDVVLLSPTHALAQQARRLNHSFAFSIQHHRPFITLKAAISLDGKLAPAPSTRHAREPVWLTGPAARADVHRLRHGSDALLTGIGTVLADDPALTDRTGLPRRRPLLRVVLDSNLRLTADTRLVSSASNDSLLLFTSAQTPAGSDNPLRGSGVEIERIPATSPSRLDLHAALAALHQRQILSVLLEGGSRINGAFLEAGLVDEVILYINETELGTGAVPFAANGTSPYALQETLSSVTRQAFPHGQGTSAEDVRVSGYLHDPWAGVE